MIRGSPSPGRSCRARESRFLVRRAAARELTQSCPVRPRRPHLPWPMRARCRSTSRHQGGSFRCPAWKGYLAAFPGCRRCLRGARDRCARDSCLSVRVSRAQRRLTRLTAAGVGEYHPTLRDSTTPCCRGGTRSCGETRIPTEWSREEDGSRSHHHSTPAAGNRSRRLTERFAHAVAPHGLNAGCGLAPRRSTRPPLR